MGEDYYAAIHGMDRTLDGREANVQDLPSAEATRLTI